MINARLHQFRYNGLHDQCYTSTEQEVLTLPERMLSIMFLNYFRSSLCYIVSGSKQCCIQPWFLDVPYFS